MSRRQREREVQLPLNNPHLQHHQNDQQQQQVFASPSTMIQTSSSSAPLLGCVAQILYISSSNSDNKKNKTKRKHEEDNKKKSKRKSTNKNDNKKKKKNQNQQKQDVDEEDEEEEEASPIAYECGDLLKMLAGGNPSSLTAITRVLPQNEKRSPDEILRPENEGLNLLIVLSGEANRKHDNWWRGRRLELAFQPLFCRTGLEKEIRRRGLLTVDARFIFRLAFEFEKAQLEKPSAGLQLVGGVGGVPQHVGLLSASATTTVSAGLAALDDDSDQDDEEEEAESDSENSNSSRDEEDDDEKKDGNEKEKASRRKHQVSSARAASWYQRYVLYDPKFLRGSCIAVLKNNNNSKTAKKNNTKKNRNNNNEENVDEDENEDEDNDDHDVPVEVIEALSKFYGAVWFGEFPSVQHFLEKVDEVVHTRVLFGTAERNQQQQQQQHSSAAAAAKNDGALSTIRKSKKLPKDDNIDVGVSVGKGNGRKRKQKSDDKNNQNQNQNQNNNDSIELDLLEEAQDMNNNNNNPWLTCGGKQQSAMTATSFGEAIAELNLLRQHQAPHEIFDDAFFGNSSQENFLRPNFIFIAPSFQDAVSAGVVVGECFDDDDDDGSSSSDEDHDDENESSSAYQKQHAKKRKEQQFQQKQEQTEEEEERKTRLQIVDAIARDDSVLIASAQWLQQCVTCGRRVTPFFDNEIFVSSTTTTTSSATRKSRKNDPSTSTSFSSLSSNQKRATCLYLDIALNIGGEVAASSDGTWRRSLTL